MSARIIRRIPMSAAVPVGCGTAGVVTVRSIQINLDASPPLADYRSAYGTHFAFTVNKGETEIFDITALSAMPNVVTEWDLVLNVTIGGKGNTYVIEDRGRHFETAGWTAGATKGTYTWTRLVAEFTVVVTTPVDRCAPPCCRLTVTGCPAVTDGLDGDLGRLQEWPCREDGPVRVRCGGPRRSAGAAGARGTVHCSRRRGYRTKASGPRGAASSLRAHRARLRWSARSSCRAAYAVTRRRARGAPGAPLKAVRKVLTRQWASRVSSLTGDRSDMPEQAWHRPWPDLGAYRA